MKQIIIILLLVLGLSLAFAHPAGVVKAVLDTETALLTVDFAHKVKDAADHYINSVEIKVNGKVAIVHSLSLQESVNGGSLVYKIPALKKGDKISVLTKCSKGGDKSANITVP